MWGVGATPLPSSAGHKGEEDDPRLFLAATPPRAPSLAVHWPIIALSVQRLGQSTVLKPDRTSEPPLSCFGAVCRGSFVSKQGIYPTSQGGLRTDLYVGCEGRNRGRSPMLP